MKYSLPGEVKLNPEIHVPVEGIKGWKVQGPAGLVVFFEIQPGTVLPKHAHCFQYGVVIDGVIILVIEGEERIYSPGDSYVIPEGIPHSARIPEGAIAMDFFSDPDRY